MTKTIISSNSLIKTFSITLVKLPTPLNISTIWNFGSLLSLCLIIQIVSGLLLSSSYSPGIETSFPLITITIETIDKSWLIRYIHANGASLFFACLYIHIGRGIFYGSMLYKHVWSVGVTILILVIATAFLGYVLPVNQISFWGASVITNLFSQIPYLGPTIVEYVWGGVSVHTITIIRFFTFHFILPFIVLAIVIVHITFLHQTGSRNPLGLTSNSIKISFNSFLSLKDLLGVLLISTLFLTLVLRHPLLLGDDENFNAANAAVTPQHIQPEWYFLFAYAILRSIPNKLGGVIALAFSVLILYTITLTFNSKIKTTRFYPLNTMLFWSFVVTVALLTWIGIRPVQEPYIITGQILTVIYFSFFIVNPLIFKLWDKLTY